MKWMPKIFGSKKRRGTSSLFQKRKKTKTTYKRRKSFSLTIDTNFLKKISYLYMFVGALIFGGLIYLFVFSQYFLVSKIKVERQDNNSNIEIAYSTLNEYIKDNIFLLDISQVKKKLFESQENLGRISVTKQFPKTLTVNLGAYKTLYNTQIQDEKYMVLSNGSVVPGSKEGFLDITLKFGDFPRFYEYKKIVPENELLKIYEIEKLIKTNFIGNKIQKVHYYIREKEAHFISETGATLIFDLLGNPKSQIEKLAVFHAENMEITNATLIYVDLRINGKLYFCDTTNEYSCQNTLNFLYGKER